MSGTVEMKLPYHQGLRPKDVVEVRSKEEILATLDGRGMLEGMPFMPEMLKYCGLRFEVSKRADKTCDTITKTGGRRLHGTVHLDNLRCDGLSHGGCEASCLLFWKEPWLRRVTCGSSQLPMLSRLGGRNGRERQYSGNSDACSEATLLRAVLRHENGERDGEPAYRCQATELVRATRPLPWWDPRQYARDVISGNVTVGRAARTLLFAAFRELVGLGRGYRTLTTAYNKFQRARGGCPWPYEAGKCEGKTPNETLDLQPGELVEVKSYDEILATLNREQKNRGLYFDSEMVPYCGRRFRVLKRVGRILDEKSGRMLRFPNECVILDDVVCQAEYSPARLLCPRGIYSYWREIWLRRVDPVRGAAQTPKDHAAAEQGHGR